MNKQLVIAYPQAAITHKGDPGIGRQRTYILCILLCQWRDELAKANGHDQHDHARLHD